MEQINLHKAENNFPQAGIKFLLKKLLKPHFKNLNKALNKRILFPIKRKSVSFSRSEELVKKYVSTLIKYYFLSQEYLTNGKNCFLLARKTVSTRSNGVFL